MRVLVGKRVGFHDLFNKSKTRYGTIQVVHRRSLSRVSSTESRTREVTTDDEQELAKEFLRAPFRQATGKPALFPWRHSRESLERLHPGSDEFERLGFLLNSEIPIKGGTTFFSMAALGAPWYSYMNSQAWKDDLAESMSWAFTQATSGIISNVYQVPFESVSQEGYGIKFDYSDNNHNGDGKMEDTTNDNENRKYDSLGLHTLDGMVDRKLSSLYQSARESGKDQIQVRLECKLIKDDPRLTPLMVNTFIFPFLTRKLLKDTPEAGKAYMELLQNPSVPGATKFLQSFDDLDAIDHTVICQVVVPCEEVFWVKHLASGEILQGIEDEEFRFVWHLIRMEMEISSSLETRNWKLTDIDDLLGGNLIV